MVEKRLSPSSREVGLSFVAQVLPESVGNRGKLFRCRWGLFDDIYELYWLHFSTGLREKLRFSLDSPGKFYR